MGKILIQIKKTPAQEEVLNKLYDSPVFPEVVVKPTLVNDNLLVRTTDEIGRQSFFQLTPEGERVSTAMWF